MIHPHPDFDPIENEPLDEDEFIEPEFKPDPISHVHSDDELEVVIKELLHNSHQLDASDITVLVTNCYVKLSGSVKSQRERDAAEKIVRLVHGVEDVQVDLIVKLNEGILPTDIGRNP